MVDVSAIASAASGFKTAIEIAKGIQALNTSTEVRQKTSDLLDAVLEARFKLIDAADTQTTLLDRIKELERQIAGFENWNSEKQRYELKAIDRGAFAYMHKPGMDQSEPALWLCPTCFENRLKSPLQFRTHERRDQHAKWGCNKCKSEVMVYYARKPSVPWEEPSD